MDEHEGQEGLWLGDSSSTSAIAKWRGRRLGIVLASVVCIAAIAVPVGFVLSSNGPHARAPETTGPANSHNVGQVAAVYTVRAAVNATTSSGSFNVTYQFDPAKEPTVPTTTTTFQCRVVTGPNAPTDAQVAGPTGGCSVPSSSSGSDTPLTGQGTIDTNPFAMVATSNVGGLGKITLRDNGTNIWEFGGADYGLAPSSSETGPGSTLSGFAGLVEGTLGQRQGALAMGGLASPTGYLDLEESEISGANQIGMGTVDGVAVTIYQVSLDPSQEPPASTLTAQEAETISASHAVLQAQGYLGMTVQVSIDASGYIRQTHSIARFADGSSTSNEDTFSDFGCAGTVLMPGQPGATTPPAGCVSPDTGVAPTTTTTTAVTPSTTTTSTTATLPPNTTTEPPSTSPSSTTTTG